MDHLKSIKMVFGTEIIVNATSLGASSSTDPIAFCLEVIDSSLHSQLGVLTTCSLNKNPTNGNTEFQIVFSPDATYGLTQPTTIILNHLQVTNGCPIAIPTIYDVLSLPADKPQLVFSDSSTDVSMCAEEFFLDILSSKGMTYRIPQSITWNVLAVNSITTSAEKVSLDTLVNTNFANLNYMKLDYATIANYTGKKVEFQVSVVNFLGNSDTKSLTVSMLGNFYLSYYLIASKRLIIDGFHSTYMLMENQVHNFYVSARIPVCTTDNAQTIASVEKNLTVSCVLYESDGTTLLLNMTTN